MVENISDEPIKVIVNDPEAVAPTITVDNPDCQIPAAAVEISENVYSQMLEGQGVGLRITADDNGQPVLIEQPAPTEEELSSAAARRRDVLLTEAATRIAPLQDAVDLGDASSDEEAALLSWKRYRVALNRLAQQEGYPARIEWPVSPAEATV
ncbi:phage tail protein [Stutzerimonas kirkiae]|nr:phage tail protein [Stutzerimonas kirkiae]